MARRRALKGIAGGLVSSFISRNNDVNGYWGIGKLYSHMLKSKVDILRIDLIQNTIEPKSSEFEFRISKYYEWMMAQIEKQNINKNYLKNTEVIIEKLPKQADPLKLKCRVEITDHYNRECVW